MLNDEARAAIVALADRGGGLLVPETVVKAAESELSPLHPLFEWNNDKAAEQHRIAIARSLIRQVRIEITTTELLAPRRVPMFSVNPDGQGYASLAYLQRDPDAARDSLMIEFARAIQHLKRARALAIELGYAAEAEKALAQLIAGAAQAAERLIPQPEPRSRRRR